MRMRRVVARLANVAGAFAVFLGLAVFAHFAMASGNGGARRDLRAYPESQVQASANHLDALAAEVPPVEASAVAAQAVLIAAPGAETVASDQTSCLSLEEAYGVISATTEGESIDAINIALNEVVRNPAGPPVDAAESPLAGRLREALNMTGSGPSCEAVFLALGDAVQLAQVAATADVANATGAVGEPSPLSPVAYHYIPPGTPGGDGGWGYRVGHD